MSGPYAEDLAWIHHMGHGDFARGAAPGLLELLDGAGLAGGHLVDLGCGTGLWARMLLDRGWRVTGVDIAPAMIELARAHAREAELHVASAFDFPVPACEAVTSLGECLGYGFDARGGPPALAALFGRVFEALAPGGLFIFDLATPERADLPTQRHRVTDDWTVLVDVEVAADRRSLTRTITSFRRAGEVWRRSDEVHPQLLYPPAEVADVLTAAGFVVETRDGYGHMGLGPGLCAFVALKPRPVGA